MKDNKIKAGSIVMDLGSGQGITSVFLAKEYGFKVYATDLWSDAEENRKFFAEMGLTDDQIIPVKVDATDLKYEKEFFDAVVSTDSYNYFVTLAGRIALDKHSADRVYRELRGDAALAEKVTETGKQALRALLENVKVALENCDVNDTQFPLDTQYYDRELVDAALADVDAMLKDCHE